MDPARTMSRREAVRRMGVLLGGAASASTVSALLAGCEAAPATAAWAPAILDAPRLEILGVVVDEILPRTDTPGATDVGVPEFIDLMLDRWADEDERARVLEGLAGLDALSRDAGGVDFLQLDGEARTALLTRLDAEAIRAREEDVDPLPFFATIKEWTLAGYYTSQAGATQELQWLAVPGRYDADLPLSEVGRTWA